MTTQHKTYRSKKTIRARKVDDENETVVTHRGPAEAHNGDYVLAHDNGDVFVYSPEEFEDQWEEVSGDPDDE